MRGTKNRPPRARRGWIEALAFAVALGGMTLAGSLPAWAEKTLAFAKLADPTEFALARDILRPHVKPNDYNPATKPDFPGWSWPDTYEKYLRSFVWIARGDLNDDGVDELFFYIEDTGYCGSIGCTILIFEKQGPTWREICGTRGYDVMRITDYVTEGGGNYREIEQRYRMFWLKGECYLDTPERLEYHPPPPGRIWKPMR